MPHCAPPVCRNATWSGSSAAGSAGVRGRRREALDGPDLGPGDLADRDEARIDRRAVHQHRAGAALPFPAALLRAGQREILAEHVEQAAHARDVDLGGRAVDREAVGRHARRLERGGGGARRQAGDVRACPRDRPGSVPGWPAAPRSRPRSHRRWRPRPPAPRRPSAAPRPPWRRGARHGTAPRRGSSRCAAHRARSG